MRISEPIEKSGYFWLPNNPDTKLPGTLRISEFGKTTLETIGIFGNTIRALIQNSAPKRIVGFLEDGNPITLDRCSPGSKIIRFGNGISKFTLSAGLTLDGAHYASEEEITFTKFKFSVEGLDEWLSISGLQVEENLQDNSARVHFTLPKRISIQLPDGITLTLTFAGGVEGTSWSTQAKVAQKAYILLTSEEPKSIQDFIALVIKINNFLCFATDKTVSLDSATGYSNDISKESVDGQRHDIPIKLYYQSSPTSKTKPNVQWHRMIFNYSHVATDFEKVLTHWLTNYEISEPAFNLYFASKSGAHKYIDGRFLSLAQGIETLHRRNSKETSMPEEEFNKLIETTLKSCPSDKREWMGKRLKYANELSLRQRIKQMIKPFQHLYGTAMDLKSFTAQVIDTRNYLTHYDTTLSSRATSEIELWNLCMKLECLFQLHFLQLMGLEIESINNLVKDNYAFRKKLETSV
ncbi:MAG TPA: hypothetical protein PK224_16665 [Nitrospira sp.]|jgi:hypothetical protein|nr:hypothetical protein [Nitrospira sp.]